MLNPLITRREVKAAYEALVALCEQWEADAHIDIRDCLTAQSPANFAEPVRAVLDTLERESRTEQP